MSSNEIKLNRIKERHKQIRLEAIRSRKFSSEEMSRMAVEFILSCLQIEKNRDDIIKSTKLS